MRKMAIMGKFRIRFSSVWSARLTAAAILLLPVTAPLTVSVAVIVWLPAVLSVALNVPAPLVNVALAGRTAAASLLVKWTVPE
jgi:hypothetical protein